MMRRISLLLIFGLLLSTPGVAFAGTGAPIYVGDSFGTNGRCTVGAAVPGGFVTSGTCGSPGETVRAANGAVVGTVRASTYPIPSSAWVSVTSAWEPVGVLRVPGGRDLPVRGSTPVPVGSQVCGFGGTTGWRCGTLLGRNASLSLPQGTVTGLLVTSICFEPGTPPGSPLYANGQLQGILLGFSGNCSAGGRSYYVPINEILRQYGLTLLTSS
ncbi:S1 family peptidase [Streptosporangium sp. NPDC001559]|uniref:S1 family peptidase n=1 Tax=Streptosporangium sp. NPDC001559 TaxID=3366187 RepID=UPI0036E8F42B